MYFLQSGNSYLQKPSGNVLLVNIDCFPLKVRNKTRISAHIIFIQNMSYS